jgi:hypothetical protein
VRILLALALAAPAAHARRAAVAPVAIQAPSLAGPGALVTPGLSPGLSSLPTLSAPTLGQSSLVLPDIPAPLETASPAAAANPVESPAPVPARTLERMPVLRALSQSVERADKKNGGNPGTVRDFAAMFDGGANAVNAADGYSVDSRGGIVNDEGVRVTGRAARYYREVRRIVDKYEGRLDLEESLDVMDDAYADVWAKLAAIEAIADREIDHPNTHLERTLLWVDGVMESRGRKTAINTHRVYFHGADNPRSEIEEGIGRVDGYLKQAERYFSPRGDAERALGRLEKVVLAFDTRGYEEIKRHLKNREREFSARYGRRFRFEYLDDLVEIPRTEQELRDGFNLVVRSPEGETSIVEAKSARVPLPHSEVLQDKVIRKLDTYLEHWDRLEEAAGTRMDSVVFSFDVGPNEDLISYLQEQESRLSERYGVPVRFLFIESVPGEGRRAEPAPLKASRSRKHKKGKKRRR